MAEAEAIELVVPFPPGGITDMAAHAVAEFLSVRWGSRVVVKHVPGDGGSAGTLYTLNAAPDGRTMLMCATGQATQNPALKRDLPYRWDQTTPVARVVASPLVLVVAGAAPWRTLRDFLTDIARNPGAYTYGTSGVGGIGGLAIARLLDAGGIAPMQVQRIVMHGGAGMLEAVMQGRTHFAVQYLAEMKELLQAGRLKALAVSGDARVGLLPDVPTGREAGFDAFELMGWSGVAGPERLPAEIVEKWATGIRALTGDGPFRARMESLGGAAAYLGPADFKAALGAEYATALRFAEKLGLRR
jgi:tripartite-type tricarboxylate transporter receptor subunit TctC